MEIREATREDCAMISRLITTLSRETIARDFTPAARESLLNTMTKEAIERYFEAGHDYHIALSGGQLLGVVATRDDSHLFHLFVEASYQGQGLARQLWELALARCQSRSGTERFTVNASLDSVEIYRRFGFVGSELAVGERGVSYVPMVWEGTSK